MTKESRLLSLFSGTRWSISLQGMHASIVSLPGSNREGVLLGMFFLPLSYQLSSPNRWVVSRAALIISGA